MPRDVTDPIAESRIDECIDSCTDDLTDKAIENGETNTWQAKRGDYTYTVNRVEGEDCFKVSFEYSLLSTVAQVLSVDDADLVLETENIQVDNTDGDVRRMRAADILLGKTPEPIRIQFYNDLIQLMSHPGLFFNFQHTEHGSIAAFNLNKNIYPYSDDFRFKEFDEAVQSVITVGHAASTYTQISLDVQSVVEEHTTEPTLPYIQ